MSTDAKETPRTEAKLNELQRGDPISTMGAFSEMAIFARQLERELAEAREEAKRHAEALDNIYKWAQEVHPWSESNDMDLEDELDCGMHLIAQELTHLRARVQAAEVVAGSATRLLNTLDPSLKGLMPASWLEDSLAAFRATDSSTK